MPRKPMPKVMTERPRPIRRLTLRPQWQPLDTETDADETHPRRLPGERPEAEQVDGAERQPGGRADRDRDARAAVRRCRRRRCRPASTRATSAVKPRLTKTPSITIARARLTDAGMVGRHAGAAGGRRSGGRSRSKRVVEAARHVADRAADVLDQARALGADRGPHLGRLGDPLDQLLRLLAGQQPAPDLVDQLAVHRLEQRPLDRLALKCPLHRLFDDRAFQHPRHRPLDRLALNRGDDRLLGGDFDRAIDPGRVGDGPARRERRPRATGRRAAGCRSGRVAGASQPAEWSRFPSRCEYKAALQASG